MSIEIKAPQFPESIAEGTVATWHRRPGEACKRDEVLVDIETDKVVMEVLAPDDGSVAEILADAGATVQSQQLIGRFVAGAGAPAATPPAADAGSAPAAADATPSPAARQLAAEHGVDTASIKGSGKGGRVTKEDVLAHVARPESATAVPAETPRASVTPSTPAAALAPRPSGDRPERRVP